MPAFRLVRTVGLFHDPEQRPPALQTGFLRPLSRGIFSQHLVAECLQFPAVDAVELHAKLENSHRQQSDRFIVVAFGEPGTALLERYKHRRQLFV